MLQMVYSNVYKHWLGCCLIQSSIISCKRRIGCAVKNRFGSTNFPSPRRMATGVDHNRLSLIIAVLEKRMGMFLQNQDAYLNVAGGVKLDEPVDLAIAISIASSFKDQPTQP